MCQLNQVQMRSFVLIFLQCYEMCFLLHSFQTSIFEMYVFDCSIKRSSTPVLWLNLILAKDGLLNRVLIHEKSIKSLCIKFEITNNSLHCTFTGIQCRNGSIFLRLFKFTIYRQFVQPCQPQATDGRLDQNDIIRRLRSLSRGSSLYSCKTKLKKLSFLAADVKFMAGLAEAKKSLHF